jgi:hypothetical protein
MARNHSLPILPLIMDFIKPTPSVGYSSHYAIAATERLPCDLVLALGLARQVAVENHFSFDLIAEGLSAFSRRWLLVEFDAGESRSLGDGFGDKVDLRPLDQFIHALGRRFASVRTLAPVAEQGVWLICEK